MPWVAPERLGAQRHDLLSTPPPPVSALLFSWAGSDVFQRQARNLGDLDVVSVVFWLKGSHAIGDGMVFLDACDH